METMIDDWHHHWGEKMWQFSFHSHVNVLSHDRIAMERSALKRRNTTGWPIRQFTTSRWLQNNRRLWTTWCVTLYVEGGWLDHIYVPKYQWALGYFKMLTEKTYNMHYNRSRMSYHEKQYCHDCTPSYTIISMIPPSSRTGRNHDFREILFIFVVLLDVVFWLSSCLSGFGSYFERLCGQMEYFRPVSISKKGFEQWQN